jgi:Lipopolysaccharide-assembly
MASCQPYTFNQKGKPTIKSIAIERFQNETAEFTLSDRMTNVIIDRFLADGSISVVDASTAEAVLSGTLTRYTRQPYVYDGNDQVSQYAVYMDFLVVLKKPGEEAEIWKENMNQIGVYTVADETEEDGQNRALELLVQSVFNKISKSW